MLILSVAYEVFALSILRSVEINDKWEAAKLGGRPTSGGKGIPTLHMLKRLNWNNLKIIATSKAVRKKTKKGESVKASLLKSRNLLFQCKSVKLIFRESRVIIESQPAWADINTRVADAVAADLAAARTYNSNDDESSDGCDGW